MLSNPNIKRDSTYELHYRVIKKLLRSLTYKKRINRRSENSKLVKDISFSIFSNNCLGGVIYHDLGKKFTSPLINTAMDGEDFIRFLERPQYYLNHELEFIQWEGHNYPIAIVDDIEIRFVHYKTTAEAEEMFRKRAKRIVWDNLFVIATNHDGLNSDELLKRFDQLPYNKIMFVSEEYPQYDWAICVPQFKGRFQVRRMTDIANLKGQYYYETVFNVADWLINNCK